jgi:hypothetical protein
VATISKKHAMFYQAEGKWYLAPLDGEVWINEKYIEEPTLLLDGDLVAFAEQELFFECNQPEVEDLVSFSPPTGGLCLLLLTLFQVIMGGQLFLRYTGQENSLILLGFGSLIVLQWVYFLVTRLVKGYSLLAELPVLYLLLYKIRIQNQDICSVQ